MIPVRSVLRDNTVARALAIGLDQMLRPAARRAPDPNGVLFVTYHDMKPNECGRFERQLRALRQFGSFVDTTSALAHLASGRGRRVCLTFDDGFVGAFRHALPILEALAAPATFFVVPGWIDAGRPGILSWDDCRALRRAGMEIGSHTMTHRRLSTLAAEEIDAELIHSRTRIEDELGAECRNFACPWGQPGEDFDADVVPSMARRAGYRCFLTTVQTRAMPGADPMSLPRLRMEPGWGRRELRYAFSR